MNHERETGEEDFLSHRSVLRLFSDVSILLKLRIVVVEGSSLVTLAVVLGTSPLAPKM